MRRFIVVLLIVSLAFGMTGPVFQAADLPISVSGLENPPGGGDSDSISPPFVPFDDDDGTELGYLWGSPAV